MPARPTAHRTNHARRRFTRPRRRARLVGVALTGALTSALVTAPLLTVPVAAEPAPAPPTPAPVTPDVQDIALGDPAAPAPDTQLSTPDGGQTLRMRVFRPETEVFSTAGVSWAHDPALDAVTVTVRTKDAATGGWSAWTPLDIEDAVAPGAAATALRGGTAPYWTGRATGVEVEVSVPADSPAPRDVRLTLIDPKHVPADAALAASAPAGNAAPGQSYAAYPQPFIHTRLAWGADESIRTWTPNYASTLKAAIIHHTTGRNDYAAADVPGMLRAIYYYHSVTMGWGDIGYNFVVDKFGRIFEGRYGGVDSTVVGGHALNFNAYTTGVSMLGNYHETDTPAPMVDAVSSIVAWKLSSFGIDPQAQTQLSSGATTLTVPTILGHRDVNNTLCPGQYGYARLPEIRDKASAALLAAGTMAAPAG